jgi:hypothetical protein
MNLTQEEKDYIEEIIFSDRCYCFGVEDLDSMRFLEERPFRKTLEKTLKIATQFKDISPDDFDKMIVEGKIKVNGMRLRRERAQDGRLYALSAYIEEGDVVSIDDKTVFVSEGTLIHSEKSF